MLSVGRIYAGGGEGGVANRGDSTKGARRRAPGGWRYLWEQVAEGAEDYYSADVARGEAAGRWGGSAAAPELGLAGQVTEEQMERVFGLLMHPSDNEVLGQGARQYRSLEQRLEAAGKAHREAWTAEWAQREMDLVDAGTGNEAIEGELATHRERAAEGYATTRTAIVFCQEHLPERLHFGRRQTSLADRIEPYTRQSRVLLGADPQGDLDVLGSEAEHWLKDQDPPD